MLSTNLMLHGKINVDAVGCTGIWCRLLIRGCTGPLGLPLLVVREAGVACLQEAAQGA